MKDEKSDTVQVVEEAPPTLLSIAPGEIIIGTLVSIDEQGKPFVEFSGNPSDHSLKAITTLKLTQTNIGRQVALLFASGDLQNPVIMGMVRSPLQEMLENFSQLQVEDEVAIESEQKNDLKINNVQVDGNKIVFDAKEEITLRCGESSIVLTWDGKILIRGKNLLTRSTGVNRILGGSVQLN